jgi:hypothetical protein
MVVINSHHLCADGGYLRHLYLNCANPALSREPRLPLPLALTDIWSAQLAAVNSQTPADSGASLIRVNWPHPKIRNPKSHYAQFLQWTCPSARLQCFDKAANRSVGVTEALWSALALSAAAHNSTLSKSLQIPSKESGILTLVDLRFLMNPRDLGINVCNNFIPLTVVPHGISPQNTVKQFGEAMRRDFVNKKDNGGFFVLQDLKKEHRPGSSVMVLSNMGLLPLRPPVADVWMQQVMESRFADGALVLLSWEKILGGRSEFFGKLRYSPNVFTDLEAAAFARSVRYALEEVDGGTRIDAAVEQLIRVQRSVTE